MIATPKEEPSVRNRVDEEDATPMSFVSTLFCATSMVTCIRQPRPRPTTAMKHPDVSRAVSVSLVDSRYRPTIISALPATGNTLYRPVGPRRLPHGGRRLDLRTSRQPWPDSVRDTALLRPPLADVTNP